MDLLRWMKNNQTKDEYFYNGLHFTHDDTDAAGCALVVAYANSDYNFSNSTYFCSIGKQDEIIDSVLSEIEVISTDECNHIPKIIIVSDISISEETCERLETFRETYGTTLLGFDHHGTNDLAETHDWWTVQKEKISKTENSEPSLISATYMLYDYYKSLDSSEYFPYGEIETLKNIVEIISDYDTWEWKKHDNDYYNEFAAAEIVSFSVNFLGAEKAFRYLFNDHYKHLSSFNAAATFPDIFYTIYEVETERYKNYLLTLKDRTRIYDYNDRVRIAMFIGENAYVSNASDYLYRTYDSIDIVMIIYPSTGTISLRTNRDYIDLGAIAKKYINGGGHPKAAGGKIASSEELSDLMNTFYTKTKYLSDIME